MSVNQASGWKSQSGYIWSLIGSAVGFANILSFSAQAYKNGGGAFLIPYFLALFLLGIPLLLLEGTIGHKWKLPLVSAYGRVWSKWGKVLGWVAILACLTIGGFYIVLTAYSFSYIFYAGASLIPEDTHSFFLKDVLQATSSIQDGGAFSFPILLATLCVAFLAWLVLSRQIQDGLEKVCSIFMPLLAAMIILFAITVCLLPGGMQGVIYYLKPDFAKLLEPSLWRDLFGQVFFSLSLGIGIIVGFSRHTGKKVNLAKAMLAVAMGDFAISFLAGLAIFGCLAHISHIQHIPFEKILTTDSSFEIGFILFPKILKAFGPLFEPILGALFFFCVFIAGITGVFSIVESIAGNLEVEFNLPRKRAVTLAACLLSALGVLFCRGNATHLIDALVPMVIGTNMLLSGLTMVIAFIFCCDSIRHASVWQPNGYLNFYGLSIRSFTPLLLSIILISNVYQEFEGYSLPTVIRWGWLGLALAISILLAFKAQPKDPNLLT